MGCFARAWWSLPGFAAYQDNETAPRFAQRGARRSARGEAQRQQPWETDSGRRATGSSRVAFRAGIARAERFVRNRDALGAGMSVRAMNGETGSSFIVVELYGEWGL